MRTKPEEVSAQYLVPSGPLQKGFKTPKEFILVLTFQSQSSVEKTFPLSFDFIYFQAVSNLY
jgi:hypothetical protein